MRKNQDTLRLSLIIFLPIIIKMLLQLFFNTNPLSDIAQLTTNKINNFYTLDPNIGFNAQALGHLAAKMWLNGIIPWWNPYEGIGMPLAGEMQVGAFSPLVLLMYFHNGIHFFHIILQILAGLGTYLFLKEFGITKNNALVGALLFEFNGTFAWLGNAVINPIPFLPLLFYAVERIINISKQQQAGGWRLFAIVFALSIYAGFPEVTYIDGLFVALYTVLRLSQLDKNERLRVIQKCCSGLIVGLMLALPIIIAFVNYLLLAHAGAGHLNGQQIQEKLPLDYIAAIFLPYLYGKLYVYQPMLLSWGRLGGYISALLLFIALCALNLKSNKLLKAFLAVWIILCIGRAYGIMPFNFIMNSLPLIKYTAIYRYYSASVEFAIIFLVCMALEQWSTALPVKKYFSSTLLITIFTIVLMCWLITNHGSFHSIRLYDPQPIIKWYSISILWAMLSLMLGYLWIEKHKLSLLKIVLVIETLVFFTIPLFSGTQHTPIELGGINFLQNNLGLQRFYTIGPIAPNYGSYFQISEINYNDLPSPATWVKYVTTKLDPYTDTICFTGTHFLKPRSPSPLNIFLKNTEHFEAIGTKYLVTWPKTLVPLPLVYQDKSMNIYALAHPKPYFEIVKGECQINPGSKTEISVNCKTDAVLLRRELYMPGWYAFANQHKFHVTPYQEIFQSIELPPGQSNFSFGFVPPYMPFGFVTLTLGTILLLIRRKNYAIEYSIRYVYKLVTDNYFR